MRLPEQEVRAPSSTVKPCGKLSAKVAGRGEHVRPVDVFAHVAGLEDEIRRALAKGERDAEHDEKADGDDDAEERCARRRPLPTRALGGRLCLASVAHEHRGRARDHGEREDQDRRARIVTRTERDEPDEVLHEQPDGDRLERGPGDTRAAAWETEHDRCATHREHEQHGKREQHTTHGKHVVVSSSRLPVDMFP